MLQLRVPRVNSLTSHPAPTLLTEAATFTAPSPTAARVPVSRGGRKGAGWPGGQGAPAQESSWRLGAKSPEPSTTCPGLHRLGPTACWLQTFPSIQKSRVSGKKKKAQRPQGIVVYNRKGGGGQRRSEVGGVLEPWPRAGLLTGPLRPTPVTGKVGRPARMPGAHRPPPHTCAQAPRGSLTPSPTVATQLPWA